MPPSAADLANALLLDQFVFDRDQAAHALTASDYLTLAQAQLATGATQAAVATLHSLAAQPMFPDATAYTSTAPDANANVDAAAALLETSQHTADALPFLQVLSATVPWSAPYRLRLADAELAGGNGPAAMPALVAVARDAAAPYATRVEAAEHLSGASTQVLENLGSAELNLLAQPGVTAAAAGHPGFTAAQLYVAAQMGTSNGDRIGLLHQAIAAAPAGVAGDRARLSLFLAEAAEPARPADEIALLDLLRRAPPPQAAGDDAATDDSADDGADDSADATSDDASDAGAQGSEATPAAASPIAAGDVTSVSLPAIAQTLDLPAQIRLAETLSEISLTVDHNVPEAIAYLQLARTLAAASPTPDATVASRIAGIEAQIELNRVNTARRPVFHAALTQKVAVRPRLTLAEAARLEVR